MVDLVKPRYAALLVNNLFAILLGEALAVLVHECVHWVVGASYGVTSTIYAFGCTTSPQLTGSAEAVTALSAPLASLALGALAAWVGPLGRRGGFAHLLWMWTAFLSLAEGINYLVTGPFGAGDIAEGARELGWPYWVTIVIALVGVAGMFASARWFATFVHRWAGDSSAAMYYCAFIPWLIATPIMVAVEFVALSTSSMALDSATGVFVAMAPFTLGLFAPMSLMFAPKLTGSVVPLELPRIPWLGVVGYAVVLLLNLVVLRPGIAIG